MSSITSEEAKELTVPLKKPDHLPAVPDHRVNYKRRTAPPAPRHRKNDCCKIFLIFLSTIFCMSTLALVGILLWREFSHQECDQNQVPVHDIFPGYFRTREEQVSYEGAVNSFPRHRPVNHSFISGLDCQFQCASYTSVNKSSTDVHLGSEDLCCQSEVSYVALGNLTNIYGIERKIAQFQSRLQFFREEKCKQNRRCTGCLCVQKYVTVTAVFEKDSKRDRDTKDDHAKYGLDWFQLPANCHCKLQS